VLRKVSAPANGLGVENVASPMALSLRVSQQEKGIAFLVAEIAARDRTIRERDEGIEWLRGVIRDKELTIVELEKGVAWLRTEIAERDGIIGALRRHSTPALDASQDDTARS